MEKVDWQEEIPEDLHLEGEEEKETPSRMRRTRGRTYGLLNFWNKCNKCEDGVYCFTMCNMKSPATCIVLTCKYRSAWCLVNGETIKAEEEFSYHLVVSFQFNLINRFLYSLENKFLQD